jgi:flavin-dependent dehydrogenase
MTQTVAIIGAGPAGSVAAIILARSGWKVQVIEQHRFPRDKICGECLSSLGLESLKRLELLDELRKLQPAIFTRCAIYASDGRQHLVNLSAPMWGLSRRSLDERFLGVAREYGVQVVQPARCERVEANPLRLALRHLESNQIETLRPGWLMVADGKPPLHRGSRRTDDFGIKAHFEKLHGPRDTIELFGCRGLYGGLAPIEQNRWNVAFSVPERRLREHRGDIRSLFAQLITENRALAARLAGAERITDWLAAPLPRFGIARLWPDRIIPVGNAAAAIEPIGGEGMGLAIRSAELAAQCLIEDRPMSWLRGEYRRLWNLRRIACRVAGLVVSSPLSSRLLLPMLDVAPAIGGLALAVLGKNQCSPSTSEIA